MVILTLLDSKEYTPLKQWRFQHETVIRIGRAPENHVIINNPVVSRFHVELRKLDLPASLNDPESSGWQIINHSANGTFVNSEAIAQAILEVTAIIQLAQDGPLVKFQVSATKPVNKASTQPQTASSNTGDQSIAPAHPTTDPIIPSSSPTRCTHNGNPPENLFCMHCGQPVRVEQTIRQYQVLRVLGRGGMGTTYLVWNPNGVPRPNGLSQGKLQVLKEMNADIARIPKAQELFEREASTLKTLNHPGIPKYHDFFVESDKKYLVMELVHGRDLEKRIRQQGPVSPQQAIEWMVQTCEVLDYLHSRTVPIIHRDIKPGNLLVRNLDNRIVVLDFGAVKEAGMPPGTRIGAEGYSAPEQVQGRPLTQSDLYAVGPSLIFLLTGSSPQRFYKRNTPNPRLNLEGVEGIPRRLQLVIRRLTELEPSDRYQTAKEVMRALKSCL